MSRRRRLSEQGEEPYAAFHTNAQTLGTPGYVDAVKAAMYAVPLHGVGYPLYNPTAVTNARYAGLPDGYPEESSYTSGTQTATHATGAPNTTANANGPINEAAGAYSRHNLSANGVYGRGSRAQGDKDDTAHPSPDR